MRQTPTLTFSGNAYYRDIRTHTLNGDINEDSLDQSVYQPSAAERAALAAAGYTGVPASGATAANTPFPSWRCIGNALLNDEPGEKCNGLLNRTRTAQHNGGRRRTGARGSARSAASSHQFTVGAAFDRSGVGFTQSTRARLPESRSQRHRRRRLRRRRHAAATSTASRTTRASISTGRSRP